MKKILLILLFSSCIATSYASHKALHKDCQRKYHTQKQAIHKQLQTLKDSKQTDPETLQQIAALQLQEKDLKESFYAENPKCKRVHSRTQRRL